jgi:translocation and assembly module TamB
MSRRARWIRRIAIFVLVVICATFAACTWVVKPVLTRILTDRFHGLASVGSWWLAGSSGINSLALHEDNSPDSTIWLTAERIQTNVSFSRIIQGKFSPSHVLIANAQLSLRFDERGQLLTKGPFGQESKSEPTAFPEIEIQNASVTIEQTGRPAFQVQGIEGKLKPSMALQELTFSTNDPTIGRWKIEGQFQADFKQGTVTLKSGQGFSVTPELAVRVPFIPPEVWSQVSAKGPLDIAVKLDIDQQSKTPLKVNTVIRLQKTATSLPVLGIHTQETTGEIEIDDGLIKIRDFKGATLQGSIQASGQVELKDKVPHVDLTIDLKQIDVASAPASWQLAETGATGKLTGNARLIINGQDLSGSSGTAVISDGQVQGIAIKAMSLFMHAEGEDIQFDTKPVNPTSFMPLIKSGTVIALLSSLLIDQEPVRIEVPKIKLPQAISTEIELENVNIAVLLARLEVLTRIKVPVPISGMLSLKARATIPLGNLTDLSKYKIGGQASLSAASIDGVHIGRVASQFNLDHGVLSLENLQGQLVDQSRQDPKKPLVKTPAFKPTDPLVAGAFRGDLRVELAPAGKLVANLEAYDLPIAELVAPYVAKPSILSGTLSASFQAEAGVAQLGNPSSWSSTGHIDSKKLRFQDYQLDELETPFTISKGHVRLIDLTATLAGHPLKAEFAIDMNGNRAFEGKLNVTDWSIERMLALSNKSAINNAPSGSLDIHASFSGTALPLSVKSDGNLLVRKMSIQNLALGDVSAVWETKDKDIHINKIHAYLFGGQITGHAEVPTEPTRPIQIQMDLKSIDSSKISAWLGTNGPKLEGMINGQLVTAIPPKFEEITAVLKLSSGSLKVQGVPAGTVKATIRDEDENLIYEATADGPEGKIRFKGEFPLSGDMQDRAANAELKAAGFKLVDIWKLAGLKSPPGLLQGRAAIDANLRARVATGMALGLHGIVEVRDLKWGHDITLGNLHGILAKTPTTFRFDQLRGDLLGGTVSGEVWGMTPTDRPVDVNFDLHADHASLHRLFSFAPHLVNRLEGSGSLHLTGRLDEILRANAELSVPKAKFAGIVLDDLRIPAELTFNPTLKTGNIHARRWSAKIAGGRIQGISAMKLGHDRTFQTELTLTGIDIETIAKTETNAARPGSGKVNGRVLLSGPDPTLPQRLKGKIELDLDDASLGEIPVIRELNRFLGSAQSGLFEDGDLLATIGNRQVSIDQFTLAGKVLQIHAMGSVSFDGALDLAVLANTNQVISQTGQSLVNVIPGLRSVLGRNEEAMLRVSSYLSSRLLKFRISGTIKNPIVTIDPGVGVGNGATGFFAGALQLPMGQNR